MNCGVSLGCRPPGGLLLARTSAQLANGCSETSRSAATAACSGAARRKLRDMAECGSSATSSPCCSVRDGTQIDQTAAAARRSLDKRPALARRRPPRQLARRTARAVRRTVVLHLAMILLVQAGRAATISHHTDPLRCQSATRRSSNSERCPALHFGGVGDGHDDSHQGGLQAHLLRGFCCSKRAPITFFASHKQRTRGALPVAVATPPPAERGKARGPLGSHISPAFTS